MLLSDYEYSCGAPITPPNHNLHGKVVTRVNLLCAMPIELSYYSSSIGRSDLFAYCDGKENITRPFCHSLYIVKPGESNLAQVDHMVNPKNSL